MTGTWIIFRDQQGIGDAVCAQLRERGATCLCVDHGEQRSQASDASMTIRPDHADDYDELLRAATSTGFCGGRRLCIFGVSTPQIPKRRI